jgi:hypothetical protein
MGSFSAMKGLASLNPQLLVEEANLELKAFDNMFVGIVFFSVFRLSIGSLGFVAFCTKFSHVVDMLETEKKIQDFMYEAKQIFILLGFCNQLIGITQIWRVQERRLLLFLFGGPDADFAEEEMCRRDALLAEITRSVCSDMFSHDKHGLKLHFKRFIAILTFTHLDIQAFALDEAAAPTHMQSSTLSGCSYDSAASSMAAATLHLTPE